MDTSSRADVGDWIEIKRAMPARNAAGTTWIPAQIVAIYEPGTPSESLIARLRSGKLLQVPPFLPWRRISEPRRLVVLPSPDEQTGGPN